MESNDSPEIPTTNKQIYKTPSMHDHTHTSLTPSTTWSPTNDSAQHRVVSHSARQPHHGTVVRAEHAIIQTPNLSALQLPSSCG